jgi:hypothetical protein
MANLIRLLVASCFAVTLAAPAFADGTKPVHHAAKPAKTKPVATQSPTDLLNAQSLQAAQGGQSFTPAASK